MSVKSEEKKLSIIISGETSAFSSKNAKKRMKDDIKKNYYNLNDETKFCESIYDLKRYLNGDYLLKITKTKEMIFNVDIVPDLKKKEEEEMRQKHKEKIRMLKNKRCNIYGKKMNDMKKKMGGDLISNYLNAQREMKDFPIPSPEEIMNNKDKYMKEFLEYDKMIKTMQKENPNSKNILKNNSYHKYAEEILKTLKKD
jgi:hypothetical protein